MSRKLAAGHGKSSLSNEASSKNQYEQDAEDVVASLKRMGLITSPEAASPNWLTRDALSAMGIAARFARWEALSIDLHRKAGLPSSKELLARIALWWRFELFAVYVRELKAKAFRIFYESFVWMKEDGTVDIAMLMLNDDEALLDAMTEFLLAELEKNEDKYGQTAKQSRRRGLLLARQ
jgi:hypothetical protein